MSAATQAGGREEDAGWFRDVQWGAHLTKRGAGAERYAWARAWAQARAGFRAAVAAAGDLMVLGLHGAPHVPDVGVRLLRHSWGPLSQGQISPCWQISQAFCAEVLCCGCQFPQRRRSLCDIALQAR